MPHQRRDLFPALARRRRRQSVLPGLPGLQGLPGLPGLSGRRQQDPRLQPDEEAVEQEKEALPEDAQPFIFDILQIPERLLGGQAIKGLLAGTGEEGIEDNLAEFARKSPIGQIIDPIGELFGVDVEGRDVTAVDVRRNFLGETGDLTSGFSNFSKNLGIELFLDPSTYTGVFALTKIGNAIRTADKATKAAKVASLSQQVAKGERTLLQMGVPFLRRLGVWDVPLPKSLNIRAAQMVEGVADFVNRAPVLKDISKGFSIAGGVASRTAGKVKSAVARNILRGGLAAGDEAGHEFLSQFEPKWTALMHKYGPALGDDPDAIPVFISLLEAGATSKDSIGSLTDLIYTRGVHRKAAKALQDALESDKDLSAIYEAALGGDVDAARLFRARRPDLPLPEDVRLNAGLEPVPNVDTPKIQLDKPTQAERLAETLESPSPEQLRRAELAKEGAGQTQRIVDESTADMIGRFNRLREAKGDDFIKELQKAVDDSRDLMRQVGEADVASGLINQVNEYYIPRHIHPEIRRKINEQFDNWVKSNRFPGSRQFVEQFMEGRRFDQLTTMEANLLVWQIGTKHTGNIPLKAFEQGGAMGVHKVFSEIFPENWVKRLKRSPGGRPAAQFFNTNPFYTFGRRLEQGARVRRNLATHEFIYDPEMPLVDETTKLGDPRTMELASDTTKKGKVILRTQKGRIKGVRSLKAGEAAEAAFSTDRKAQAHIVRNQIKDDIKREVSAETRALNEQFKSIGPEDAYKQLEEARVLSADSPISDLGIRETDLLTVKNQKRNIRQLQEAKAQLKAAKDPRTVQALEQRIAWLTEKVEGTRSALNAEFGDIQGIKEAFVKATTKSIRTEGARRLQAAKDIVFEQLDRPQTTDALELYRRSSQDGVAAIDELRRLDPERFERMRQVAKDATVVWGDKDLFNSIDAALERLRRPDSLKRSLGWLDSATWGIKAWLVLPFTFINTRFRDFVTNHTLLAQAGISPAGMTFGQKTAFKINRGFRKMLDGDPEALRKIKVNRSVAGEVETLTGEDIVREFQRRGLLDSGYVRDIQVTDLERIINLNTNKRQSLWHKVMSVFDPRPTRSALIRPGFRLAQFGDNQARLVGALAEWRAGKPLHEAIERVKAWTYDPRVTMTTFERTVMRRAFFFYGWMRFAIRTEMQAFATRPGSVAVWQKMWDAANKAVNIKPEDYETSLPEWMGETLSVPFRRDENGNPEFFVLGNYLPIGELAEFANFIGNLADTKHKDTLEKYVGERSTPIIQNLVELVKNESYFSESPIASFPGERDEIFGLSVPKWAHALWSNLRLLTQIDRLNVFDVTAFEFGPGAVPRGEEVGAKAEPDFMTRLASGAFGVVPRVHTADIRRESLRKDVVNSIEKGRIRSMIRSRLGALGKPETEDELEALREELARLEAKGQTIDASVKRQLGLNLELLKKERRRQRRRQ